MQAEVSGHRTMIITLDVTPGLEEFLNQQTLSSVKRPVLQIQIMDWKQYESVKLGQVSVSVVFGSADGSSFVDQYKLSLDKFLNVAKESYRNIEVLGYSLDVVGIPVYNVPMENQIVMGVYPGVNDQTTVTVAQTISYDPQTYIGTPYFTPQWKMWPDQRSSLEAAQNSIFGFSKDQAVEIKNVGNPSKAEPRKRAIEETNGPRRAIEL